MFVIKTTNKFNVSYLVNNWSIFEKYYGVCAFHEICEFQEKYFNDASILEDLYIEYIHIVKN